MNQPVNTSLPPQHGPHASVPSVETTYEFEIMLPYSKAWTKTTSRDEDGKPFTDPQRAWDYWATVADTSDAGRCAQVRLIQIDRRVLAPVCEPVEGWEAYHRGVALIDADRARYAEQTSDF